MTTLAQRIRDEAVRIPDRDHYYALLRIASEVAEMEITVCVIRGRLDLLAAHDHETEDSA